MKISFEVEIETHQNPLGKKRLANRKTKFDLEIERLTFHQKIGGGRGKAQSNKVWQPQHKTIKKKSQNQREPIGPKMKQERKNTPKSRSQEKKKKKTRPIKEKVSSTR
ncbi:hypothetical protein YC2023_085646 [Brassica napus]